MQFTEELVSNKQAIENNYVIELDHGTGSKVKSSGPIFDVSTGNAELKPSPLLGENTEEVLMSIGYKKEKIDALFKNKSIGQNI